MSRASPPSLQRNISMLPVPVNQPKGVPRNIPFLFYNKCPFQQKYVLTDVTYQPKEKESLVEGRDQGKEYNGGRGTVDC
jgi:hypothetical protein